MADISLSAGKAIEVFRAICEIGAPCSFAEIAQRMDYPRTVTNRMVATLMHYDFLERDGDTGLYSVSPKVLHLIQKSVHNDPVMRRAEVIMHEVVERTGDTALLMMRSGYQAMVMSRLEGRAPITIIGSRVGMELPLHCGGAPVALLAHCSDDFIRSYLEQPLARRTDKTCVDPEGIWQIIRETRARGYAVGDQDLFDFVVALGVPLIDARGQVVAAISIGNIIQKYPPERIREVGETLTEIAGKFAD